MNNKSYKYPLLNDHDWLYKNYITNSLSTNKMRDMVGCKTSNSVRQALIRHGISLRNISEGLTIHNPPIHINQSMIDGCLLGDAWLFRHNPNSDISMPYFIKKNKYIDHIEYNIKQLYPTHNDISEFVSYETKIINDVIVGYYVFRTPVYKELHSFYDRWYLSGTRQPPNDIQISPELLLNWFLDDGSSYHRRKDSKSKQITITFSCEGFYPENVKRLVEKLCNTTEMEFKMSPCNSGYGYRITLQQHYTNSFFKYIGACPVESLKYKWK